MFNKTKFAVGTVVQIRDFTGFAPRTVHRFTGTCCVVEKITVGTSGYNALIRVKGAKPNDDFQSITVKCERLVAIKQLPKGTVQAAVLAAKARYTQKHGDVFRMTSVRDVDVAGTLLELRPGERFRLEEGQSWTLVYIGVEQDHPHYTDRAGDWINELLDAGVIELVKPALASPFGPVAVDEWSYNPTTFSTLAFGEVAKTIGENPAFPYVRKADTGTWFYVAESVRPYVRNWGIKIGEDGWCIVQNAGEHFRKHFSWVNSLDFTFVTAFEYPALRRHTEDAFTRRINAGH